MQYECDLCGLCNTILNFCENNMDQCACQDINECTNGMAQCPNNSVCQNDVGNYTCPCASGYQGTAAAVLKASLLQKPSYFSSLLWSKEMLSGLAFL